MPSPLGRTFPALCALVFFTQASTCVRPALADTGEKLSFGPFYGRQQVSLQRRLPPVMDVSGKSISVQVAPDPRAPAAAVELRSAIENLLTKEGSGVQVGGNSPDLVVDCQITAYKTPAITKSTENKVTTQTVSGALQAVFHITEVRTRRLVASGKVDKQVSQAVGSSSQFDKITFHDLLHKPGGNGASKPVNSTLDAENAMVDDVAKQVASYLVTTTETVEAALAVGKTVDQANKLAKTSLWTRDLEALETVSPAEDPRVEAYRIYNIGVANEALGYAAQDAKSAIKYLQEASLDYGKAITDRPEESYFLEPQNRIKAALEHYMPAKPTPPPTPEQKAKDEPPVSNDDIVAMVQAQMDSALILENIRDANKVDFDLSSSGQIKLTRAGVKSPIIMAMKQRAAKGASPGEAPPTQRAAAGPVAAGKPPATRQRATKSTAAPVPQQ